MSIILFIVILAMLILVHELGHFIAAKRAGVRVDEFGIGFPPRLWSKKAGETVYSVNTFPVGGFVKIFGEDPNEESLNGEQVSRSLTSKSKLTQAWIISAGVVFNLLFAWMLISIGFMIGQPFPSSDPMYGSRVENPALTIMRVSSETPAYEAGLKAGDIILSVASRGDSLTNPSVEATRRFIASHEKIKLTYLRDGEQAVVDISSIEGIVSGSRAIGISMDTIGVLNLPVHNALYAGLVTTVSVTSEMAVGLLDFFKKIFIGQGSLNGVSGPVGIVGIVGDASHLGVIHLLSLTAIISINLAIINLLPFPALDGGRLLFIIIEVLKRSPIKPEIANITNGIGFLVLIAFMVFITFHDIVKIVEG